MHGSIKCPSCGHAFEITDAIATDLRESVRREFDERAIAERARLAQQQKDLESARELLAREKSDVEAQIKKQLDAERQKLISAEAERAKQSVQTTLEQLQAQLTDERSRRETAQKNELALRQQQAEVENAKKELELTLARERDIVRAQVAQSKEEEFRLKEAEWKQKLDQMSKQADEMKRRAEQGSQQSQGEVLELDIERQLIEAFPRDGITEVAKGVNGADIHQIVRNDLGAECGLICWEAKRVKTWQSSFTEKLRADGRKANASAVAICSTCPPHKSFTGLERIDGVWVCSPALLLPLATVLRQTLIGLTQIRKSYEGKETKMSQVYDYISSQSFADRMLRLRDTFVAMRSDIDAEKRAMDRLWKAREKQLTNLISGTSELRDEIHAILGADIPGLGSADLRALADQSDAD